MADVLKAARAYQDKLRWCIFPCHGKKPALPEKQGGHGFLDATLDFYAFERVWRTYAADSIGIPCVTNGFFALDVDPRNGGDDTLCALTAMYGELPRTVMQLNDSTHG